MTWIIKKILKHALWSRMWSILINVLGTLECLFYWFWVDHSPSLFFSIPQVFKVKLADNVQVFYIFTNFLLILPITEKYQI